MTTCRQTIALALKLARVIASGGQPSADEAADGLVCLQSFYDGLVAAGMFGRLADIYRTTTYEAQEGERVTAPEGVEVSFPETVEDTDEGGVRAPRDLACIEIAVGGVRDVRIMDRTAWVSLLGLGLDSAAPLAGRGAVGLASALATSAAFAAMFGDADLSPAVRAAGLQFIASLSLKPGTTRDRIPAEYY